MSLSIHFKCEIDDAGSDTFLIPCCRKVKLVTFRAKDKVDCFKDIVILAGISSVKAIPGLRAVFSRRPCRATKHVRAYAVALAPRLILAPVGGDLRKNYRFRDGFAL